MFLEGITGLYEQMCYTQQPENQVLPFFFKLRDLPSSKVLPLKHPASGYNIPLPHIFFRLHNAKREFYPGLYYFLLTALQTGFSVPSIC